jgi:hypothetical protein
MDILGGLRKLIETLQAQLINIPTDNGLSFFYVILNLALLLAASILGSGTVNTGTTGTGGLGL